MANEKRLIAESERANLICCLKKLHDIDFTPGVYEHSVIGRAALLLEETADAVEVVRCKDCKHGCEDHEDAYLCNNAYYGLMGFTRGDDFCSYGERRTDGK